MIKNEYVFTIMVGEPKIGEGIVLKLRDGRIVRTSRVVDYFVWSANHAHTAPRARSFSTTVTEK